MFKATYTGRYAGNLRLVLLGGAREQKSERRKRMGLAKPKRCPVCREPTKQVQLVTGQRECLSCGTRFGNGKVVRRDADKRRPRRTGHQLKYRHAARG